MTDLPEQIDQLRFAAVRLANQAWDDIVIHERGIQVAREVRAKLVPVGLSQSHPYGLIADLDRLSEKLERIEQDANARVVVFKQPDHPFNSGVYVVERVTPTRIFIRRPGNQYSDCYDRSGKPVQCWEGSEGIDIRATFGIDSDVLPGSFQL